MRSEGYGTWSVCLLLNISLTFYVFIHATNDTNLGSVYMKVEMFKRFYSENASKLERFLLVATATWSLGHLYSTENAHAYE